ncbi:MAG: hypothetical protein J6Z09_09500 [Lachnospiraceae bacterium]|nr:hypothetical protein [Lachnospiraceae bacterium]
MTQIIFWSVLLVVEVISYIIIVKKLKATNAPKKVNILALLAFLIVFATIFKFIAFPIVG